MKQKPEERCSKRSVKFEDAWHVSVATRSESVRKKIFKYPNAGKKELDKVTTVC